MLNAGNFGVAQSRKRTFIWAAAPGELLPDWPRLMHCFRTPQLTINLPGGVQYRAVPQTVRACLGAQARSMCSGVWRVAGACCLLAGCPRPLGGAPHIAAPSSQLTPCLTLTAPCSPRQVGAPLRPVTVRDAIGDLPEIASGHAEEEMEYTSGPVSACKTERMEECKQASKRDGKIKT